MPSDISQQRRQAAGNRVEALASPEYVQTSKRFVMNAIGFDSFCMCLTPCLTESGSLKRRRHAAASAAAGHAARHADAPADAAGHAANAARNAALHGSGTRCIAASRPIVQVMGWQSQAIRMRKQGPYHAKFSLPCPTMTMSWPGVVGVSIVKSQAGNMMAPVPPPPHQAQPFPSLPSSCERNAAFTMGPLSAVMSCTMCFGKPERQSANPD